MSRLRVGLTVCLLTVGAAAAPAPELIAIAKPRLRLVRPTRTQETSMLLVREIMYCKPGKVRPMVERFLAMAKLSRRLTPPQRGSSV